MSTQITRLVSPNVGIAIAAALALSACDRGAATKSEPAATTAAAAPNAELTWARAAFQRNPDLEVVATDQQTGVVTLKHRSTGDIETVKASELVAVSPSQLQAMTAQRPVQTSEPEQEPAATISQQSNTPERSEGAAPVPGATPSGYTVDRSNGQIRVSGPGVSIVSSGANASASNQVGTGRKTVDPFICEGRRTLQLDNRDIYVEGDAITVRDGCELFLTNSNIVASGTGIVVEGGTVHISNSHVEGSSASFQADDRAKVYVRSSTFQGVPRRAELAMVQDQGGNKWR
jgi:hypothetical protein